MLKADYMYQAQILQGVSRTFALTIPQLPSALHPVISNAYLLCRITDTIEDEPMLSSIQKQYFTDFFIEVVAKTANPEEFSQVLLPLLSDSTLIAEKELILNTPRVIGLTHHFSALQQQTLLRCVRIMGKGMVQFQQQNTLAGLKNLTELNDYCYCVAGVVGEMLTELFCDYSPEIAKNQVQLEKLAVSFGQGLQMTNILKDIWTDQQRGVCWLPQDIFSQNGCDLLQLSTQHHTIAFKTSLLQLITIATEHLHNALRYILLIPKKEQGIRRFCLWAVGMAILTLRRIYQNPFFTDGQQVKISRRSVKGVILLSNTAAYNDTSLNFLFYLLTKKIRT